VELQRVKIPLSRPYLFGRGLVDGLESIITRIKGEDGTEGIGECVVRAITSSFETAEKELLNDYIPAILGLDSMDIELIMKKLHPENSLDLGPIAGIDLALWDLNGKAMGVPVYKLLGGAYNLKIPVSYTLSIDTPEVMTENTLKMMQYGYQTFVVKIGHGPIEEDISRVRLIRKAVPPGIKIRLDANAAFDVKSAIIVLGAIKDLDVEYIEQPIPPGNIEGLKKIAAATDIPICIDEGLEQISDAINLVRSNAVRIFNIKIPQCGGLWLSKKIAAVAAGAGIPCICGGRMTLEITRQASRQFAVSTPQTCYGYAHEGAGPASQSVTGSVTKTTLNYDDIKEGQGYLIPTKGNGLGVELDDDMVNRYSMID
jgi:L-alanine-DL-glutamate epimerase-like enolase superfamily enzyme